MRRCPVWGGWRSINSRVYVTNPQWTETNKLTSKVKSIKKDRKMMYMSKRCTVFRTYSHIHLLLAWYPGDEEERNKLHADLLKCRFHSKALFQWALFPPVAILSPPRFQTPTRWGNWMQNYAFRSSIQWKFGTHIATGWIRPMAVLPKLIGLFEMEGSQSCLAFGQKMFVESTPLTQWKSLLGRHIWAPTKAIDMFIFLNLFYWRYSDVCNIWWKLLLKKV